MDANDIDTLWDRMTDIYGSDWQRKFGDHDRNNTWLSALRTFERRDVLQALGRMVSVYPNYPPNLPQFRSLCADLRRQRILESSYALDAPKGRVGTLSEAEEWTLALQKLLLQKKPRRTARNIKSGLWTEEHERAFQERCKEIGYDVPRAELGSQTRDE